MKKFICITMCIKSICKKLLCSLIFILVTTPFILTGAISGPLKVDSGRYFVDPIGNRVYLTGWHTWNLLQNLSEEPKINFTNYVHDLTEAGANYIRLWQLDRRWWGSFPEAGTPSGGAGWVDEIPYARSSVCCSDGETQNKWDLTKYNENYFNRLSQYCQFAQSQGVYVSVMLFEACDSVGYGYPTSWNRSPYNKINNINGVLTSWSNMYRLSGTTFAYGEATTISNIYKSYIHKVVDTVNQYDNVLYEVMNEGLPISKDFQYWVINEIHSYESTKPKKHLVGITSFWGSPTDNNILLNSPADWWSPHGTPDDHYEYYRTDPPITTGTKAVFLDTDHLWGLDWDYGNNYHYPIWAWKAALRGYNPIYMDPGPYDSWWDNTHSTNWLRNTELMLALSDTKHYVDRIILNKSFPSTTISSTKFCLANTTDNKYLVLQPIPGASFSVSVSSGIYSLEWYDLASGNFNVATNISLVQGINTFNPYYKSIPCVLFLQKTGILTEPTDPTEPTQTKLVNGSFEFGFDGWTVSGNCRVREGSATDGLNTISFNSGDSIPNAVLSQTVATTSGQQYTLSLDQGVLAYNFSEQRLKVIIQGASTLVSQTISIFGSSWNGAIKWQSKSFTFTADSSSVKIIIQDVSPTSASLDMLLDNVKLIELYKPTVSLINGSFESDFYGWTVSGNCGIGSRTTTDGIKLVAFNQGNSVPNAIIFQNVNTVPNTTYTLTFDQAIYSFNTKEQRLLVTIQGNGTITSQTFSLFGSYGGAIKWSSRSLSFKANSSTTKIIFQDVSPATDSLDMWLDKVVLK